MLKFFDSMRNWQRILLALFLLAISFLAIGQAVTLAWLSSFPAQAGRLEILNIKFWFYISAAAIAAIIDALVVVRIIKLKLNSQVGRGKPTALNNRKN